MVEKENRSFFINPLGKLFSEDLDPNGQFAEKYMLLNQPEIIHTFNLNKTLSVRLSNIEYDPYQDLLLGELGWIFVRIHEQNARVDYMGITKKGTDVCTKLTTEQKQQLENLWDKYTIKDDLQSIFNMNELAFFAFSNQLDLIG